MPGFLVDLIWVDPLGLSMGKKDNLKKMGKKKKRSSSRKDEHVERKWGHPCYIWMLP